MCQHLNLFKLTGSSNKQGSANATHTKSTHKIGLEAFQGLQQFLQTWQQSSKLAVASGTASDLKMTLTPVCNECKSLSSRLHTCLECTYFGCWKNGHALAHMKEESHFLACDVQRNQIYCFACKDYVYDSECEAIVLEQSKLAEARVLAANNRIPYYDWVPSQNEAQILNAHSKPRVLGDESTLGLRGLNNLGNTCFMNCILQALIHNPLLRNYFLADQHTESTCYIKSKQLQSQDSSMMQIDKTTSNSNGSHSNGSHSVDMYSNVGHNNNSNSMNLDSGPNTNDSLCMACEMDQLLRRFFSGDTQPHTPYQFLHSVWKHAKHLAGYEQQDAHEFFIATLNAMHMHCRGTTNDCHCIIHRIFTGALQSDVTCLRCSTVSSTVDPFWDISLDLRHHKSTNTDVNDHSPNSLTECLNRFIRPEKLGEKFFCSRCNHYEECVKQLTIKSLPIVVCCHLKRFEHSVRSYKIDTFIEFPAHLDMSPFLSSTVLKAKAQSGTTTKGQLKGEVNTIIANHSSFSCGEYMYSLYAVVNHHGNIDNGHYTCYVRHNTKWFQCDDAWISLVNLEDVLESKGYLLFYIKDELEYSM